MRKRPFALFVASLLFLYFPLELAVRWWLAVPVGWVDLLIFAALPLLLLIGLVRVTRVGWYTLIAFVSLWGIHDLHFFYRMQSENLFPLLAHLAIYVLTLGYFITPRIRVLYFDPTLCWWKSKPRYETNLPAIVKGKEAFHYPILRNLSEGGCFIETPHPMPVDTWMDICIPLPVPLGVPVIHSQGEVRWVSHNPLRPGMGVQFKTQGADHRKAIAQAVRHQL